MKHYKIIFITILCSLVLPCVYAQSIGKSVVASNGSSFSGSGIIVDWTIGQPVATYAAPSGLQVTEGFHPVSDYVSTTGIATTKGLANSLTVKAYPNPAGSVLHLSVRQSNAQQLTVQVTDLLGKEMQSFQLPALVNTDKDMDLSALSPGSYFLIVGEGQDNAQVMKFVKN